MKIVINNNLTRTYTDERGERKVVYFTLTDNNGVEYKMLDDIPASEDAQEYLEANIDKEMLFVRQEEYKERPVFSPMTEKTVVELFDEWIAEGCKIQVGVDGEDNPVYKTVSKRTWRSRW